MSAAPASPAGNDVAVFDTLERAALLAAWRRTIKTPPPKGISRQLMVQILAYEAQVQQHGGLTPAVRRRRARSSGVLPVPNRVSKATLGSRIAGRGSEGDAQLRVSV